MARRRVLLLLPKSMKLCAFKPTPTPCTPSSRLPPDTVIIILVRTRFVFVGRIVNAVALGIGFAMLARLKMTLPLCLCVMQWHVLRGIMIRGGGGVFLSTTELCGGVVVSEVLQGGDAARPRAPRRTRQGGSGIRTIVYRGRARYPVHHVVVQVAIVLPLVAARRAAAAILGIGQLLLLLLLVLIVLLLHPALDAVGEVVLPLLLVAAGPGEARRAGLVFGDLVGDFAQGVRLMGSGAVAALVATVVGVVFRRRCVRVLEIYRV